MGRQEAGLNLEKALHSLIFERVVMIKAGEKIYATLAGYGKFKMGFIPSFFI